MYSLKGAPTFELVAIPSLFNPLEKCIKFQLGTRCGEKKIDCVMSLDINFNTSSV